MPPLDPYCGLAPGPAELAARWNVDPLLLAVMAGLAGAYVFGRRGGAERLAFAAAMVVLLVAFVSPLCAWSSALFSARVGHHLLVVTLAAPLLAFGLPAPAGGRLGLATLAQGAVLWLWHAPGPYAWALSGTAPYWLMELSLLGASVAFWRALRAQASDPVRATAALLATTVQTGLLGALITFAPRPLYAPHAATTLPWGLTPLQDQQLAGVIMWAPGALPYLLAALALTAAWLGPQGRPASPSPQGRSW